MTGEKDQKTQEKKEPELVSLKDVAKKAGVEPREARSILRKLSARGEGEKRQRWQFHPKEVDSVVSKIKKAVAEKAQAKEAKAEAAEEEEEE